MFAPLADGSDIKCLCTIAVASALRILDLQSSVSSRASCHGVSPIFIVNVNVYRRYTISFSG